MNADGGIYWRSSPDWNTAEASARNGFYPDTIIKVTCYQSGATNVPGSSDSMREQASWVSGTGHGSRWISERFHRRWIGDQPAVAGRTAMRASSRALAYAAPHVG